MNFTSVRRSCTILRTLIFGGTARTLDQCATTGPKTMLHLAFVFDDAIRVLSQHGDRLELAPLPATVYLMQVDVINHYRYALDHYLTVPLDAAILHDWSIGTPYQKWASFTNRDFAKLSFAIHNLLRYTSRLFHETETKYLVDSLQSIELDSERWDQMKTTSNAYTFALCEISSPEKAIGVAVYPDQRLSITRARMAWGQEKAGWSATARGTSYFRIVQGSDENERREPIGCEEYERIVENAQRESIDITDRSRLMAVKERGHAELADLRERNGKFKQVCDNFYRSRPVTEPFENLNESWWI